MEFIVIHPSCYQILTHTFINYFFCLDWAQHGISGRAVFLDLYRYYTSPKSDQGVPSPLPYDPWTSHSITVPELEACARAQGVTFKKADILLIRIGFIKKYMESSQEEKDALAGKEETL